MRRLGRAAFAYAIIVVVSAGSARAQSAPAISFRPFIALVDERFTAARSFDATFGQSAEPLYGGGLQITVHDRLFIDVTAERFSKSGDQVFVNNGQVFHLGIPLTATLTPFEVIAGYRFHVRRRRRPVPWLLPYVGAGVGWYAYRQTSAFADPSEYVDTAKTGVIGVAGAEFRLHKWVGIAGDVVYTHVPGILGSNHSVSHEFGENDLGGVAGRFRLIIGR